MYPAIQIPLELEWTWAKADGYDILSVDAELDQQVHIPMSLSLFLSYEQTDCTCACV